MKNMDYGKGGGGKSGGAHGPGGVKSLDKNPNKKTDVNDSPTGPFSHTMGHTGDGGMHGGETVSGKNGGKFNFK